jgi:hypothetical protein
MTVLGKRTGFRQEQSFRLLKSSAARTTFQVWTTRSTLDPNNRSIRKVTRVSNMIPNATWGCHIDKIKCRVVQVEARLEIIMPRNDDDRGLPRLARGQSQNADQWKSDCRCD